MLKKKYLIIILSIIGIGFLLFWYGQKLLNSGSLERLAIRQISQSVLPNKGATQLAGQNFFGLDKPRNYLVLFLNNTELRPGGGFIGAYAVVEIKNGLLNLLKIEGTEKIDNAADKNFLPQPPIPIAKYLKVAKWYFRDSNWSPDFASSSELGLKFYGLEKGLKAEKIDGVVGITPTVIEALLKISGPVKWNGQEYTPENFTKQLEYEVEYGYAERGEDFSERKQALTKMFKVVADKFKTDVLLNWRKYLDLAQNLLAQKQIVFYFTSPAEEQIADSRGWTGKMLNTDGDYLLWVDANLGALKTDAAIKRNLSYSIFSAPAGLTATAKMNYQHTGKFDWRTTRYLDYARVFVPEGSMLNKIIFVSGKNKIENIAADQGAENGRQWFGAFISVEPSATGSLAFTYLLPKSIGNAAAYGQYYLKTQKQIGALNSVLTLNLDFGNKKITTASPAEAPVNFGDNKYNLQTDLSVDREFNLKLK